MGRAIDNENAIDKLQRDMKQLKTAFEGLASTVEMLQNASPVKKNIDLHEETKKTTTKKKELAEEEA